MTSADLGDRLFRPQLVASDLDGTLLPPSLDFTQATLDGVRALRDGGVVFALCTGRMFRSARVMAGRLGLVDGPIVCYQGGLIADLASGRTLFHRSIEPDAAAEVVRHARAIRRHLNAYVDDEFYVEQDDEWARFYAEYAAVPMTVVDDLLTVVSQGPTKFVICAQPDEVTSLLPQLQQHWRGRLYVTRSLPCYIEICDARVSKSVALDWLCGHIGALRERTVACGDGLNDIDMLVWAGLGVAVAEADTAVREAADVVVERDALGDLFRRLAETPDG